MRNNSNVATPKAGSAPQGSTPFREVQDSGIFEMNETLKSYQNAALAKNLQMLSISSTLAKMPAPGNTVEFLNESPSSPQCAGLLNHMQELSISSTLAQVPCLATAVVLLPRACSGEGPAVTRRKSSHGLNSVGKAIAKPERGRCRSRNRVHGNRRRREHAPSR